MHVSCVLFQMVANCLLVYTFIILHNISWYLFPACMSFCRCCCCCRPGTSFIDQTGLEFMEICLLMSPECWDQRLCTTTTRHFFKIYSTLSMHYNLFNQSSLMALIFTQSFAFESDAGIRSLVLPLTGFQCINRIRSYMCNSQDKGDAHFSFLMNVTSLCFLKSVPTLPVGEHLFFSPLKPS